MGQKSLGHIFCINADFEIDLHMTGGYFIS
jgi:hypothetical protein